jgi:hypothetical protein
MKAAQEDCAWLRSLASPEESGRVAGLRDLADSSPSLFLDWAKVALRNCNDTAESRQLLSMLTTRGWLPGLIREVAEEDPGLAGGIVQLGQAMHPGLERELSLSGNAGPGERTARPGPGIPAACLETIQKLLALLPARQPASALSPRSRARLAQICGSLFRLQPLWESLLSDEDARVRATAVEALWAQAPPPSPERSDWNDRLWTMAQDPAHRVSVNALVALSLAGDERALSGLVRKAEAGEGAARLAAFWGMGRSGDVRFHVFIRQWRLKFRNDMASLRGSLAALVRLRQAELLSRARNGRLRVLSSRVIEGQIRIEAVAPGAGPDLRGGHLQPWVGDTPVWNYQATIESPGPPCRVLFITAPGEARREWEQRWANVQGDSRCEAYFDPEAGPGDWTHIVLLGDDAEPGPALAEVGPETRVYRLGGRRASDSAETFQDLAEALRAVWVLRMPLPPPEAGPLTLRLRSPRWLAGPVDASASAEP